METEDASELMFGDDFDNVQCLSLGEVQSILKEKQDEMQEEVFHDVFEKTLVYVNRFSKFENKETMKEIKNYLQKQGLHEFEMASLTNLVPPTIEEAKALIPSLSKLNDDQLQSILDELENFRKFN